MLGLLVILLFFLALFLFLKKPSPKNYIFPSKPIPTPPFKEVLAFALSTLLPSSISLQVRQFLQTPDFAFHEHTRSFINRFGHVVEFCPFPGKTYLIIRDPLVAQSIRNFPKPEASQTSYQEAIPLGLLSMQDPLNPNPESPSLWKQHRKFMQPFFSLSFVNQMTPTMISLSLRALEQINNILQKNSSKKIDIHSQMTNLTLDIIYKTSLGFDLNATTNPDSELIELIKISMDWVASAQLTPFKIWKIFPKLSPGFQHFLKAKSVLHKRLEEIIQLTRERMVSEDQLEPNFLSALLLSPKIEDNESQQQQDDQQQPPTKNQKHQWTNKELRDETLTIVAAGHETTNNALTFFFNNMAKNPQIQKKVQEEIDSLVTYPITPENFPNIEKFKYMNMCFKESMRLDPSVPLISRTVPYDVLIENEDKTGGYQLGKGTTVIIDVGSMNRHPGFWEKPDEFYPEHFGGEGEKKRDPFAFIPFSVGMKSCIGSRYAALEFRVIAVMVLSEFFIEECGDEKMEVDWQITAKPKNGCWLSLKKRRE